MSAAGVTVRLEPIARQRSAFSPSSVALVNSSSGRSCPKLIIVSFRGPIHFGSSHFLPINSGVHCFYLEYVFPNHYQNELTCQMTFAPTSTHLHVPQILFTTFFTTLKIAISMKFTEP